MISTNNQFNSIGGDHPAVVHSGVWYSKDLPGQGISLQVRSDGGWTAYFFTYDLKGLHQWFICVKEPDYGLADVYSVSGQFESENATEKRVGLANLEIDGENLIFWYDIKDFGYNGILLDAGMEALITNVRWDHRWSGQGLIYHVFHSEKFLDKTSRIMLHWFTHDLKGNQRWWVGDGLITSKDGSYLQSDITLYETRQGARMYPSDIHEFEVGTAHWHNVNFLDHFSYRLEAPNMSQQNVYSPRGL